MQRDTVQLPVITGYNEFIGIEIEFVIVNLPIGDCHAFQIGNGIESDCGDLGIDFVKDFGDENEI